jgi:histidyl-tRNA synthetase
VDKISKAGLEETRKSLELLAGGSSAEKILAFTGTGADGRESFEETLDRVTELSGGPSDESERLRLLFRFMQDSGTAASFSIDPSITRGLDYYTGVVFETFLTELPDIGSICSGGRYDNLCGIYSKNQISGVGSSIGLDRMIAALESLGKLPPSPGYAAIAIAAVKQEQSGACQALADKFRQLGIACEVFLEASALVKQYVAAEKKGIRYLVIPGGAFSDPLTLREIAKRHDRQFSSVIELLEWASGVL